MTTQYPDMQFRQTGTETWTATIAGQTLALTYRQWQALRDALDDEWIVEIEEQLFLQAQEADDEERKHQRACRAYNGWGA